MAVPKKKTSKQKKKQRNSHNAIPLVNLNLNKETGEYRLSHRMSLKDWNYNGKNLKVSKVKEEKEKKAL